MLNEEKGIQELLLPLQRWREQGAEILVCDGGSTDATVQKAVGLAEEIIRSPSGRARQMNAGAARARGDVLLFLHSDSQFPFCPLHELRQAYQTAQSAGGGFWGWFRVSLSGKDRRLRMVEQFMRWRSRFTGIATGDQGIFVSTQLFRGIGGYEPLPLMEDIRLSSRLSAMSRPVVLNSELRTSSRRWESQGIWKTILLMWRIRLAFFLGVPACRLWELYYGRR